jgi:hypothetical protein
MFQVSRLMGRNTSRDRIDINLRDKTMADKHGGTNQTQDGAGMEARIDTDGVTYRRS